jgi:hypothetical protein
MFEHRRELLATSLVQIPFLLLHRELLIRDAWLLKIFGHVAAGGAPCRSASAQYQRSAPFSRALIHRAL